MTRKFNPHGYRRLLDPQRVQYNDPAQMLTALAVEPGHTVLDVGCGPGWFTIPAARLAGSRGKVYALDVSPEMLAVLERRLRQARPGPAEDQKDLAPAATRTEPDSGSVPRAPVQLVLISEGASWPLADNCCQRVLVANVFHEVDDVDKLLAELARVTRPDGLVLLADWRAEPTPMGPPMDHRLPTAAVKATCIAAGFQVIAEPPVGPYHFSLLLRPPAVEAAAHP